MKYELSSSDNLTELVTRLGIDNWELLTSYIRELPYGRNANRQDFSLVLIEKRGTCSSKHALLKKIAQQNNVPEVKLFLGIYKMNERNTPHIGYELRRNGLDYLPEAHCYLTIDGNYVDFTAMNANFEVIQKDILVEKEIEPEQVAEFKVLFHQQFLHQWLIESDLKIGVDDLWAIREKCIQNISEHHPENP